MGSLAALNLDFAPIQWVVVIAACAVAAVTDLQSRRIPNWLSVPLFVSGLAAAIAFRGGWGALDALLASALLMAPYIVLFLFAGGGAGDAKLMAGVGAWLGVLNGMAALLAVAVTGVILAIWWGRTFGARGEKGMMMPYGVAIGFGVCLAALGVSLWQNFGTSIAA